MFNPNNFLKHQYPDVINRYPKLIKLVYALNYFTQLRKWYIMKAWKQMLSKMPLTFTAIDIGSGEGQYIVPLCNIYNHAQFIALDNRESNKLFCDSLSIPNLKSICLDIEEKTPEFKADLVICIGVMQYINNDVAALMNIYKCVKQGGLFLLYVPINGHFITKVYPYIFNNYTQYEQINNRKRVYVEKEILEILRYVGFNIKEKRYTYGFAGKLSHELLNSCTTLIFSAPLFIKIVAGIVLIVLIPIIILLMFIDYYTIKKDGNGLLLILSK